MSALGNLFDQLKAFDRPPVESWHPTETIDFDLRIAINGEWFHEGEIIPRKNLVKLFSTVLALRQGDYFLITPGIGYRIKVDDVPFQAVECTTQGEGEAQQIYFRTDMDEVVLADTEHPIEVEINPDNDQPSPYVEVRSGLKARMTRPVYYQLVEMCLDGVEADSSSSQIFGVWSAGTLFPIS